MFQKFFKKSTKKKFQKKKKFFQFFFNFFKAQVLHSEVQDRGPGPEAQALTPELLCMGFWTWASEHGLLSLSFWAWVLGLPLEAQAQKLRSLGPEG